MGYAPLDPYFLLDSPQAGHAAWEAAGYETPGRFFL